VSTPARPVPQPDEDSAPFWDAAARHELVIQKCASCGTVRHPPRPMCPACHSTDVTWVQARGRGRVWSWVVAHPPVLPAFADKVPYNVVVIQLEEGIRMIGNMIDVPLDQITEGLEVTITFEDLEEGVSLPAWRPA